MHSNIVMVTAVDPEHHTQQQCLSSCSSVWPDTAAGIFLTLAMGLYPIAGPGHALRAPWGTGSNA